MEYQVTVIAEQNLMEKSELWELHRNKMFIIGACKSADLKLLKLISNDFLFNTMLNRKPSDISLGSFVFKRFYDEPFEDTIIQM